jgi:hypothetical protein
LTILKAFSEDDAIMKVVPFFLLYEFALMTKVKSQMDFEL